MTAKKQLSPFLLFSSFMFLQFVILRMGNQAGRGFLSDGAQENVYVFLQIFVICGIVLHTVLKSLLKSKRASDTVTACALGVCVPCTAIMIFAPIDSAFYLAVSFIAVFCVGVIAGAVYLRMSAYCASGLKAGIGMGAGYSAALLLQFLFQLQWLVKPVIAALALTAAAVLGSIFIRGETEVRPHGEGGSVSAGHIASVCVISAALLLFTAFYNGYIHHLQVASGYGEYNVYTWPRLLMIPGMLLFGAIGDHKKGKLLPLLCLCFSIVALLNALLAGQSDMYWLNMCLYYVSISSAVSYYNLTFWKLAPHTKHPSVWSVAGRALDSIMIIPLCLVSVSDASAAVILALNIAALVVIIILMAVNGSFDFIPKTANRAELLPDSRLSEIQERYGLTPAEIRVFKELVLTEDKQTVISDRLSIKVRTMQANITSIYKKTGVTTRSGLVSIYQAPKD